VVNRACRTASTFCQPCKPSTVRFFWSHSAAAAAACGVADEVPAPSIVMSSWQPRIDHGVLGVYAAIAVLIFAGGPKQPCILRCRPALKYGVRSAVTPQTATTRLNRAGYTIVLGGDRPMRLPAAAKIATPAS